MCPQLNALTMQAALHLSTPVMITQCSVLHAPETYVLTNHCCQITNSVGNRLAADLDLM
jgi:hypothetical protein